MTLVPNQKKLSSLVFRIRKKYFQQIVHGQKTIEYRRDSAFWKKRIEKLEKVPNRDAWMPENLLAVFICGKCSIRKRIIYIERIQTPENFSAQGNKDVDTPTCFAIHLGSEVKL